MACVIADGSFGGVRGGVPTDEWIKDELFVGAIAGVFERWFKGTMTGVRKEGSVDGR